MPLASGVPTIRWDVVLNIHWPDGVKEWIGCGHRHYNEDGAIRCAKKYNRLGIVWSAFSSSQYGVYKIKLYKGVMVGPLGPNSYYPSDVSRILGIAEYNAEWKLREAAAAAQKAMG